MFKFYFEKPDDAVRVLDGIREIAITYGSVALADIRDLAGKSTNYKDNDIMWNAHSAILANYFFDPCKNCYVLEMPKPDKSNDRIKSENKDKSNRVCNVTIDISSMKSPERIVREVFKIADELKDTNVFIHIC